VPEGRDDEELNIVGGEKKHQTRRSADPTNVWGFLLAIGKQWGFPAIAACAAAWMLWTVLTWQRDDSKIFVDAVNRNTTALDRLADEQKVQTTTLKTIDTNLQNHLDKDDHHH
jgi:hypothetical protein